jgi:hypothetical protein
MFKKTKFNHITKYYRSFPPEAGTHFAWLIQDDKVEIKKLWQNHRLTKNKLKLAIFTSAGLIFMPAVYGYI